MPKIYNRMFISVLKAFSLNESCIKDMLKLFIVFAYDIKTSFLMYRGF